VEGSILLQHLANASFEMENNPLCYFIRKIRKKGNEKNGFGVWCEHTYTSDSRTVEEKSTCCYATLSLDQLNR